MKNPASGTKVYRSPIVAISVVSNKHGWYINVVVNQVPYTTLGPYEEEMTLPEALQLVAVDAKLNGYLNRN